MSEQPDPAPPEKHDDLVSVLARIRAADGDGTSVSIRDILTAAGTRSFGPVVLVAGMVVLMPLIGDIPGVPTLMGMLVLLTAGQLLFRRQHIWLPRWLSNRTVPRDKLRTGLHWMYRPARFVDRYTGPRLTWLLDRGGNLTLALACVLVALTLPLMEVVPFSANGGGLALVMFGLAMIARDGVLAAIALCLTAGTLAVVATSLL